MDTIKFLLQLVKTIKPLILLKRDKFKNTKKPCPEKVTGSGFLLEPLRSTINTRNVVVQGHLSKVGQIDLSDVRLKRSSRKRAFLNKLFFLKNYSVNI